MNNIFDILPDKFFNIFNTSDKKVYSDCIFVIYNYMKDNASFSSLKENIIFELKKYFNNHIVEFDEENSSNSKDKAMYVYRRLKDCGWLVEEQGTNYQIYSSFEDYATLIIETFLNLDKENAVEYSSMVYTIYSAFERFNIQEGHKILEVQYAATQELMSKLKTLNTNIKKYIKKLLRDNMKNDLNQLLDSLLGNYQMTIVDRAFYNLTTRDHPAKYRSSIIYQLNQIREDDRTIDAIVRNIMLSKSIEYKEAQRIFDKQTLYIIDSFEGILDLINEISKKNEKFVASAINRIMFLLSVKEDIGGKINDIIKEGKECKEVFEQITQFSTCKLLDKKSLYTPRVLTRKIENQEIEHIELDNEIKKEAILKLKFNEKYTRVNIEKRVMEILKDKKQILASEYFDYTEDLSMFILTWLYGYNQNSKYEIEPLDYLSIKERYEFKEFVIKEKKYE